MPLKVALAPLQATVLKVGSSSCSQAMMHFGVHATKAAHLAKVVEHTGPMATIHVLLIVDKIGVHDNPA